MRRNYRTTTESRSSALAVVTDPDQIAEIIEEALKAYAEEMAQSPKSEPYLNAEAAALYMDCDKQRIYDLHSQRKLEFRKDGSRLLTRREWIDRYLHEVD